MAVFMAVQILGWITYAHAGEPAGSTAPPTTPPLPISRPAVRRALREFDRFLDHHPLLEDQLRVNPQLSTNQAFLKENPELRDFLRANPKVAEGLKIYPRYFLNRALLRQASAPVSFRELALFRDLFQQQPKLEQELTENPELIRDPVFLESHPALRDFLVQHPVLARVFLPPSVPPEPQ
jgi:hypothetical protein